jgi:hypothetical protein
VIFSYNGFRHQQNEVSFTIDSQALRSQGNVFYAQRVRWTCRGAILGQTTQAGITAAIEQYQSVYSQDGGDVVFYLDDGVTPTAQALYSADCIGGTRIVQSISFPATYGTAQYIPGYGPDYSFVIEGELALTNQNIILKYHEEVATHGTGGPNIVWIPVAQGPYIQQQTTEQSTYRVTQSGSAVGLYYSPSPPPPIFPAAELGTMREIKYGSPEQYGLYNWPVSWSYTFESSGGIGNGQPNPYPV